MVSCKTIVAHLSEYVDGDATAEMRQKIERHLRGCRRCSAVYDSTRKMLVITGDERVFEVPHRIQRPPARLSRWSARERFNNLTHRVFKRRRTESVPRNLGPIWVQ